MKTLSAKKFLQTLSGSKRPCLFLCSDDAGQEIEVVVKFRESVTGNTLGLVSEAICSELAQALGLSTPQGYFVNIRPHMGEFIAERDYANVVNASAGINYGSSLVKRGSATFPFSLRVPRQAPEWTREVFATDFMIQNFDRQESNPNLLFDGKDYFLIDHEQALGRLYQAAALDANVWDVDPLYSHLFYTLMDMATDWSTFYAKYGNISKQQIEKWFAQLPQEWLVRPAEISKLKGYLHWLRTNLNRMDDMMKSMISS